VQEDFRLILDIVTVLVAATAGGLLASFLRQPVLLGYLLAGILVGPTGLGWIKEVIQVETLAQFGVTFLLFTLGVEFSLSQLRKVQGIALGGGILQILLTILVTAALSVVTGWVTTLVQGIFLGAILSLSSTAVVLKTLSEANQTETLHGKAMLGILIVQDLAVGLMLAVLPALDHPAKEIGWSLLKAILEIGLFGAAATGAGVWIVPNFLKILANQNSKELFLLGVICLCSGVSLVTQKLGISSEMGAFVTGLMISEVEYADQTLAYVEPVRDVFAALFFASIGMLIDPHFIFAHIPLIVSLVALVMVGKSVITTVLAQRFQYPFPTALLVGIGLSQIGEFSFVLASEGQSLGLVSRQFYLLLISTTAVTLLVSPFLLKSAPTLFRILKKVPLFLRWFEAADQPREVTASAPSRSHIVICGYGQVGQDIVRLLESRHYPLLVIEESEVAIQYLRQQGIPYIYGNAGSSLVLEKAHIEQAKALVITFPDPISTRLCLKHVRTLAPDLDLVVRALNRDDIEQFYQLGAKKVVHPEFEGSLEMCSHLLQELGEPSSSIQEEMATIRISHYEDLKSPHPSCLIRPEVDPPVESEVTPVLQETSPYLWWENPHERHVILVDPISEESYADPQTS
jgi:CPA2 family monovalent cation:H+ antiporter-2